MVICSKVHSLRLLSARENAPFYNEFSVGIQLILLMSIKLHFSIIRRELRVAIGNRNMESALIKRHKALCIHCIYVFWMLCTGK